MPEKLPKAPGIDDDDDDDDRPWLGAPTGCTLEGNLCYAPPGVT